MVSMPAMDLCNHLHFVGAITYIFVLHFLYFDFTLNKVKEIMKKDKTYEKLLRFLGTETVEEEL